MPLRYFARSSKSPTSNQQFFKHLQGFSVLKILVVVTHEYTAHPDTIMSVEVIQLVVDLLNDYFIIIHVHNPLYQ